MTVQQEFAKAYSVTTSAGLFTMPRQGSPQEMESDHEKLSIRPTHATNGVWVNRWGGDANTNGDSSFYIPPRVEVVVPYVKELSMVSESGTVVVSIHGLRTPDYREV